MNRIAAPAAVLLLGAALSACGGGAPTDASVQEFCDAQGSLFSNVDLGADQPPSEEDLAGAFQDWGAELEEVGTPEDIPDEARAGFEDIVAEVQAVDDSDFSEEALQDQLDELDPGFDEDAQAFTSYVADTCSGFLDDSGELPEVPELPDAE